MSKKQWPHRNKCVRRSKTDGFLQPKKLNRLKTLSPRVYYNDVFLMITEHVSLRVVLVKIRLGSVEHDVYCKKHSEHF